MAKLLFRLNGVPEEEADEIRELLDTNNLDYYETSEGRWKISVAAIWLKDDTDYESARALIDTKQVEIHERYTEQRQQVQARGLLGNLWYSFWHQPLQFVVYLVAIAIVLAISLWPFFRL